MCPYVQVIAALSAVVFVAGTPLHTRAAVSMPADGMAEQSGDGDALVPAEEVTLSFDMHLDLAAVLLEFPGVEAPVRRQAQVNAFVSRQVAGRLRSLSPFKVGSRPNDRHSKVRSDPNGDHVFRDLLAQPYAGVVALGDDIRETVVNGGFNFDVGIVRENLRECRPERCIRRVLARGDAHGAGGLVPKLA